jgi:hypothetical protein
MAVQSNVDTECDLLEEFVDNADGEKAHADGDAPTTALHEVVRRIAVQAGVPRFKVDEVVERVLAATGAEVEARLREQVREVMLEYRFGSPPRTDGQLPETKVPEQATALPA